MTARPYTLFNTTVYEWMRHFNQLADGFFYDVKGLSEAECDALVQLAVPEGGLFVVYPTLEPGRIGIGKAFSVEEFLADPTLADGANAIAMAGVGSSALGTAALARDVANATGRPVIGLVTGYGMANLLSEALGGFFCFHLHNVMNRAVDAWVTLYDAAVAVGSVRQPVLIELAKQLRRNIGLRRDSKALLTLLMANPEGIELLVGHSKGSFMVEDALYGVSLHGGRGDWQVVTLGAVVDVPDRFANLIQYIGTFDLLGIVNSTPWTKRTWLPAKGHSLNVNLPAAAPIDATAQVSASVPAAPAGAERWMARRSRGRALVAGRAPMAPEAPKATLADSLPALGAANPLNALSAGVVRALRG